MNNVIELDHIMKKEGLVTIRIGEVPITFDLSFLHERRYAASYITNLPYPQHDIDDRLFKAFVRPGDVVLDAGANIGVTAALALEAGAVRVYCVEAEASLVRRLHAISDPRIAIQHCALGGEAGFATLMLSTHNQGHSISPQMREVFPTVYTEKTQQITMKTVLDVTNGEYCSVWKLDVEGVEPDVIRGGLALIAEKGPRVIFAEIYAPFADDTIGMLSPWYDGKRAALRLDNYQLELLPISTGDLPDEYARISPTYVFERRSI